MNPYEVIIACGDTTPTGKVELLCENDSPTLRWMLEAALNPYITYGMRADKCTTIVEPIEHDDFEYNIKLVKHFLHKLSTRSLTGHAAVDAYYDLLANLNAQQQNMMIWILDRDFKVGLGVKTVNKAFPGLIPEWNIQKAEELDYKLIHTIEYPIAAELKYNGVRNFAFIADGVVTHYSSSGKVVDNFHNFDEELLKLADGDSVVFDGEVHGLGHHVNSYHEVQSQRGKKSGYDGSGMRYTVFDVLAYGDYKNGRCLEKYIDRKAKLISRFATSGTDDHTKALVKNARYKIIRSVEELKKYVNSVWEKGGEGLILKKMNGVYSFKRNSDWLKLKGKKTKDLKIVGFVEGKEGRAGTMGAFIVDNDGKKVHCPMGKGVTVEMAAEFWENRKAYRGKMAEVQFQDVTENGSLLLPKFVRMRPDKD